MKKSDLICPNCKSNLYLDGTFIYNDVLDSDITSDKHICINESCELNNNETHIMWCDMGDIFGGGHKILRKLFPNNKYAAINSLAKKQEIEIYKSGLKKSIYLHQIFTLYWLKPYIDIKYKGNYMGDVLSKTYHLKFLKKGSHNEYTILYVSSISHLISNIKSFYRILKYYNQNNQNIYAINSLYDEFEIKINNHWWKKYFLLFKKILYNTTYDDILKKKNFIISVDKFRDKELTREMYEIFLIKCPNTLDLYTLLKRYNLSGAYMNNLTRTKILKTILKK